MILFYHTHPFLPRSGNHTPTMLSKHAIGRDGGAGDWSGRELLVGPFSLMGLFDRRRGPVLCYRSSYGNLCPCFRMSKRKAPCVQGDGTQPLVVVLWAKRDRRAVLPIAQHRMAPRCGVCGWGKGVPSPLPNGLFLAANLQGYCYTIPTRARSVHLRRGRWGYEVAPYPFSMTSEHQKRQSSCPREKLRKGHARNLAVT